MVYGQDYNRSEFSGFGDITKTDIPRGTRLRWSGVISVPFYPSGTNSAINSYLAQRNLSAETIDWEYQGIAPFTFETGIVTYRAYITFVTPIDWNTYDAFGVVTDAVGKATGQTPLDVTGEILLMPSGYNPAKQQPVYPTPPSNVPGGSGDSGANAPDNTFSNWLDDLASSFNISSSTLQTVLIGGLALLIVLPSLTGRRR